MKFTSEKDYNSYRKGEVIFNEGDRLSGVFCVHSGVIKLSKLSSNGKTQIVKLVKPGDLLGQRSVISGENVNLTAKALTSVEGCFFPRELIMKTIHENSDFAFETLKCIAFDLKEADDEIVKISHKTVKQRLVEIFLYIRDKFGMDQAGYLDLVLSRKDYANMVGSSVESTIRTLSELKDEGIIKTSGKRIGIQNVGKARNILNGY
ncbi:Crp/Fnr family transcriptional regulator [Robertkochia solimangrovi]|nr:Crp/Fnr family transcriptional regulator [Robertkochia solimangrovi]